MPLSINEQRRIEEEWKGTGMYKIIRGCEYSGGEKTVHDDCAEWWIERINQVLEEKAKEVEKLSNVTVQMKKGNTDTTVELNAKFTKDVLSLLKGDTDLSSNK